jgi:hypothetical protein
MYLVTLENAKQMTKNITRDCEVKIANVQQLWRHVLQIQRGQLWQLLLNLLEDLADSTKLVQS